MNKNKNLKIIIIALLVIITIIVIGVLYSRIQIINILHQDNDSHKLGIVIKSDKIVLSKEYEENMKHLWGNLDKSNPENLEIIANYINENVYNSPYLTYQDETYKPIIVVNQDSFDISLKSLDTDKIEHILSVEAEEDIVNYGKLVLTPLVHFGMKAQIGSLQENAEQLVKR